MAVINIHVRRLPAPAAEVGALLDSLASEGDRLWPAPAWPPMRFDRPLGVGAVGGHGPVRYTVEHYEPGRWVRFRFTGPRGFDGFHEFTVQPADGGADLIHLLAMHARGPARLTWPLAFRWMHDACLEDSFDRAERALTGSVRHPARWTLLVRVLRWIAERAEGSEPVAPESVSAIKAAAAG
ncbi:SRPBCC family protein [Nocardia amikacinitolerans]|uniref:SRPBCC family protein n=1 Tax=Nocardia amikacinitolerans TaxID=756689 RepID=UPI0020A3ED16|nr:SRPBCC family protein [Nocardia amikacinitolerans]MCP2274558.1 Polyketide cyclase / dehydrase and lipid transport [Nocardia amikacinitolerans]MCP2297096.1 Polyketide cyclase / dehydrase and lipid transport [Nocardia amikacinitolerans]